MTIALKSPFPTQAEIREAAVKPILQGGWKWWGLFAVLTAIIAAGVAAYGYQVMKGLSVTGLDQRVSWGFYISNLIFFMGISYGAAIASAVMRLTSVPWRHGLTRMLETIGLAAALSGALFPVLDLGRPDRAWYLIRYGQIGSPVVWDVIVVTNYLVAVLLFLYLPLIPDMAFCRDQLGQKVGRIRRILYRGLAVGWGGRPNQRRVLGQSITVMSILIIPVAAAVPSVLAWLFAVTVRPGWDSTIFAPYFVLAAIFSGVAALVVVLALVRKAYHLESVITEQHFKMLGYGLIALGAAYLYFMVAEYVTEGYKMGESGTQLELVLTGRLAWLFWTFVIGGIILPILAIALPFTRNILGITIAAFAMVLGMYAKRFLIVVPGLAESILPAGKLTIYHPSWVEITITVAAAAAIPWFLMVFFRLFPVISIYEDGTAEAAASGEGE
ncbi:MAG TPA: NrfD/PsrC family molybdoenzyme membrane anchor subunit [Tepidiformaceae bacterium]